MSNEPIEYWGLNSPRAFDALSPMGLLCYRIIPIGKNQAEEWENNEIGKFEIQFHYKGLPYPIKVPMAVTETGYKEVKVNLDKLILSAMKIELYGK